MTMVLITNFKGWYGANLKTGAGGPLPCLLWFRQLYQEIIGPKNIKSTRTYAQVDPYSKQF